MSNNPIDNLKRKEQQQFTDAIEREMPKAQPAPKPAAPPPAPTPMPPPQMGDVVAPQPVVIDPNNLPTGTPNYVNTEPVGGNFSAPPTMELTGGATSQEVLDSVVKPTVDAELRNTEAFNAQSDANVRAATQELLYPALYTPPSIDQLRNEFVYNSGLQRTWFQQQQALADEQTRQANSWTQEALDRLGRIPPPSGSATGNAFEWVEKFLGFKKDASGRQYLEFNRGGGIQNTNIPATLLYSLGLAQNLVMGVGIDIANAGTSAFNALPAWLKNSTAKLADGSNPVGWLANQLIEANNFFTPARPQNIQWQGNKLNDGKSNFIEAIRGAQYGFSDDKGVGFGTKEDKGFRVGMPAGKGFGFDVNPSLLAGLAVDVFVGAKVDKLLALGGRAARGAAVTADTTDPALREWQRANLTNPGEAQLNKPGAVIVTPPPTSTGKTAQQFQQLEFSFMQNVPRNSPVQIPAKAASTAKKVRQVQRASQQLELKLDDLPEAAPPSPPKVSQHVKPKVVAQPDEPLTLKPGSTIAESPHVEISTPTKVVKATTTTQAIAKEMAAEATAIVGKLPDEAVDVIKAAAQAVDDAIPEVIASGTVNSIEEIKQVLDDLPAVVVDDPALQGVANVVNATIRNNALGELAKAVGVNADEAVAALDDTADIGRKFVGEVPKVELPPNLELPNADSFTLVPVADEPLFHGTRVVNHTLKGTDPIVGGARNELGTAHYLTTDNNVAGFAAKADSATNLPGGVNREIGSPSIYDVKLSPEAKLVDAKAPSSAYNDLARQLGVDVGSTPKSLVQVFDEVSQRLDEVEALTFQRQFTEALRTSGIDGARAGNTIAIYNPAAITDEVANASIFSKLPEPDGLPRTGGFFYSLLPRKKFEQFVQPGSKAVQHLTKLLEVDGLWYPLIAVEQQAKLVISGAYNIAASIAKVDSAVRENFPLLVAKTSNELQGLQKQAKYLPAFNEQAKPLGTSAKEALDSLVPVSRVESIKPGQVIPELLDGFKQAGTSLMPLIVVKNDELGNSFKALMGEDWLATWKAAKAEDVNKFEMIPAYVFDSEEAAQVAVNQFLPTLAKTGIDDSVEVIPKLNASLELAADSVKQTGSEFSKSIAADANVKLHAQTVHELKHLLNDEAVAASELIDTSGLWDDITIPNDTAIMHHTGYVIDYIDDATLATRYNDVVRSLVDPNHPGYVFRELDDWHITVSDVEADDFAFVDFFRTIDRITDDLLLGDYTVTDALQRLEEVRSEILDYIDDTLGIYKAMNAGTIDYAQFPGVNLGKRLSNDYVAHYDRQVLDKAFTTYAEFSDNAPGLLRERGLLGAVLELYRSTRLYKIVNQFLVSKDIVKTADAVDTNTSKVIAGVNLIGALDVALLSMPQIKQTLYRHVPDWDKSLKRYPVGQVVEVPLFQSVATSPDINGGTFGDVLLVIKDGVGHKLLFNPGEGEALIPRNQRFYVESVDEASKTITMRQLDGDSLIGINAQGLWKEGKKLFAGVGFSETGVPQQLRSIYQALEEKVWNTLGKVRTETPPKLPANTTLNPLARPLKDIKSFMEQEGLTELKPIKDVLDDEALVTSNYKALTLVGWKNPVKKLLDNPAASPEVLYSTKVALEGLVGVAKSTNAPAQIPALNEYIAKISEKLASIKDSVAAAFGGDKYKSFIVAPDNVFMKLPVDMVYQKALKLGTSFTLKLPTLPAGVTLDGYEEAVWSRLEEAAKDLLNNDVKYRDQGIIEYSQAHRSYSNISEVLGYSFREMLDVIAWKTAEAMSPEVANKYMNNLLAFKPPDKMAPHELLIASKADKHWINDKWKFAPKPQDPFEVGMATYDIPTATKAYDELNEIALTKPLSKAEVQALDKKLHELYEHIQELKKNSPCDL